MGSDDLPLYIPKKKMYRRKKAHSGDDIHKDLVDKAEEAEQVTQKDKALFCKNCGKFRLYKNRVDLYVEYELRKGGWWRIWFCGKCHNGLREDCLE